MALRSVLEETWIYNVCSFWGDFPIASLTSIQEQCMYTDQKGLPQSVCQAATQRCENKIEVWLNNLIIFQHSLLSQIYHIAGIYFSHLDCIVCVSNPFLLMPFRSPLFSKSPLWDKHNFHYYIYCTVSLNILLLLDYCYIDKMIAKPHKSSIYGLAF